MPDDKPGQQTTPSSPAAPSTTPSTGGNTGGRPEPIRNPETITKSVPPGELGEKRRG